MRNEMGQGERNGGAETWTEIAWAGRGRGPVSPGEGESSRADYSVHWQRPRLQLVVGNLDNRIVSLVTC